MSRSGSRDGAVTRVTRCVCEKIAQNAAQAVTICQNLHITVAVEKIGRKNLGYICDQINLP
jgi:hypothetical protein